LRRGEEQAAERTHELLGVHAQRAVDHERLRHRVTSNPNVSKLLVGERAKGRARVPRRPPFLHVPSCRAGFETYESVRIFKL
jgi:hypothetical protein